MFRSLLLLLATLASATAAELAVTLESSASYALTHNPTLEAARLRVAEARGRSRQSGRLSNPELEVDLQRNTRSQESSVEIALLQRFPLTARLRLEKAVSRAELAAAEAEVRDAERKLAGEVRALVVKGLALNGQRTLREKQIANGQELAGFLRRRVEAGEASLLDAAQVELEARLLETELVQLEVEQTTVLASLRPLLGVWPETKLRITGTLPTPRRLTHVNGPLQRPDLEASEHLTEAARQNEALARAKRWEDIGIGLSYTGERMEDAPEGLERDNFVGLKFSLPLPFWNNNAGNIDEAAAKTARAAKEAEALQLQARTEATGAHAEVAALERVITEIDDLLMPKAAQIETQARDAYSTGQTPLPEVLRARDRRLQIERQRLDVLRDYHLARVRYEAAIGQPSSKQ